MVASPLYTKSQLYSLFPPTASVDLKQVREVKQQAKSVDPAEIMDKQRVAEIEISTLKGKEGLVILLYYVKAMENFYKFYDKETSRLACKKQRIQIEADLLAKSLDKQALDSAFSYHIKKLKQSAYDLVTTPLHIASIRDWIVFINLKRMYWTFCRLNLNSMFLVAKTLHWIDGLDRLLGLHTDVDGFLAKINAPNAFLSALGVAVFASRFAINFSMLIKHTFFPKNKDKMTTTQKQRFCYELNKRYCDMLNDLCWGIVNSLSNYAHFFGISATVAGWLSAGFLAFDALLLAHRLMAENSFYRSQITRLDREYDEVGENITLKGLIDSQKQALLVQWKTNQATFWFNLAAAILLCTGCCVSVALIGTLFLPIAYFSCVIAAAMYLSSDSFTAMCESKLQLQAKQSSNEDKDLEAAQKDYRSARNKFIGSIVKNTLVPSVLIITFAISWPVALALTVLFLGYEATRYFLSHKEAPEPAPASNSDQAGGTGLLAAAL